jgi:hypothetical protein
MASYGVSLSFSPIADREVLLTAVHTTRIKLGSATGHRVVSIFLNLFQGCFTGLILPKESPIYVFMPIAPIKVCNGNKDVIIFNSLKASNWSSLIY